MSKNKFGKVVVLSLLATLGLTSCSNEKQAKPTDYDDPLITVDDYDEEIYNNVLNVVYDAIRDGTLASDVLNEILYQYSISVFGRYNKIVTPNSDSTTLKEAVKNVKDNTATDGTVSNANVANQFIKDHKAYWSYNADGKRVNDDGDTIVEVEDNADACQSEYARLVAKWDTIENRISENMYNAISGGSYSTRNIFKEENYLMNLRKSLNKVADPANNTTQLYT
ncbi:MAG: hypothetical protein ACI31G_02725, partial [Bacilli bacterium]